MHDLMWMINGRGHGVVIEPPRHKPGRGGAEPISDEELCKARKWRSEGLTWEAIAGRLQRDPTSVRRRVMGIVR